MFNKGPKLNELYFGDVEAYDEALLHREFFEASYVPPDSMSVDALKNNQKFIVVGRKGAGKTAVQMHFAKQAEETQGYFTQFFRFFDDMKPGDYNEITKSQSHISFAMAIDDRKIFLNYDYRPAWERIFFNKLAVMLLGKGKTNKFTSFCAPGGSAIKSIFQGIGKSLKIKLSADMMGIAGELGFDLSHIGEKGDLPLEEHNVIARELFIRHCYQYRIYLFVDELVFSKLDASPDEIRVRAAMVRDIIRCARELNNDMAINEIDVHFVCSLRPELRNLINDLDSEIGKVIDGRCSIPDDHISSRRSAFFMARSVLRDIRDGK